jgi:periplasmic protein TonB
MVRTFSAGSRPSRVGLLLVICLAHAAVLGWLGRTVAVPVPSRPVVTPRVVGRLVAEPSAVAHAVAARRPSPVVARPARPRAVAVKPDRVRPAPASVAPQAPPAPGPMEQSAASSPPSPAPGPLNDTGRVQLPVSRASGLDNPLPVYPALSRRLHEEGLVRLSVLILADGRVAEVSVLKSSGFPRLDAAALAAVRRWHYLPARRDGAAIAWRHVQPVAFSLND